MFHSSVHMANCPYLCSSDLLPPYIIYILKLLIVPHSYELMDYDQTLYMQPQAREKAEKEGFEVSVAKTSFKANTKALAENEGEGLAKVIFLYLSLDTIILQKLIKCLFGFLDCKGNGFKTFGF